MASETYCGKSCELCEQKQQEQCPGCRNGPGIQFQGCEIARCCREKNHNDCGTCTSFSYCSLRSRKEGMPQERQDRQDREEQQRQRQQQNAPVLARWLGIMFWLFIPEIVAGLLADDMVTSGWPVLWLPGMVLSMFCQLLYGYAMWRMQNIHPTYRTAALFTFVLAVCNGINELLPEPFMTIFTLILGVVGLYATYLEYTTHRDVVEPTNTRLADNWQKLWQWNIWMMAALIVSLLLLWLPALATLLALAAGIAALVLQVLKLVYLYRTAQHFRQFIPIEKR